MKNRCTVEVFWGGAWQAAAEVRLFGRGHRSDSTFLSYLGDYPVEHLDHADARAVSVRYPVSFALYEPGHFPAFCIDLMPQGEARRLLEERLRRPGGDAVTDWAVLLGGARNPVGNLRVREAVEGSPVPASAVQVGISREEVVRRGEGLRAWAAAEGIPMTGSTDTTGAAPKLLLTADAAGQFHADGVLPDARAAQHFIVKYPRGRTRRDGLVLASEAPYLEVGRALGLRCAAPLTYAPGALFVPRFDRQVRADGTGVARLGMESLYAVLGEVRAGAVLSFEAACAAIARHVQDPHGDLIEVVCRDVVSVALGNPDNHGRNTALLKSPEGGVVLSPVFDFAPMFLDPDGVQRMTRWRSELDGRLDWEDVCRALEPLVPGALLRPALQRLAERLAEAPALMRDCGVEAEVIAARSAAIQDTVRALRALGGGR